MNSYLDTVKDVYKKAAIKPDIGLCCTTSPVWQLPGLHIPGKMLKMNYGCGNTVNPMDLQGDPDILYVGVGGGLELLQFSYFSRRLGAITGLDAVDEMMDACRLNLLEAEKTNSWLDNRFVTLVKGDALHLPFEDQIYDVAAQNCLFNVFFQDDLEMALKEMYRVLKPNGRLILSDPVCGQEMPGNLLEDEKLRAMCISGAIPLERYIDIIAGIGFGTVEIRAKRLYRMLTPGHFPIDSPIYIESVEVCAIKDPLPADGPCVFTGRTAIYTGEESFYNDGNGHILFNNQPLSVCDKTALILEQDPDIFISPSTWFYDGGGCC